TPGRRRWPAIELCTWRRRRRRGPSSCRSWPPRSSGGCPSASASTLLRVCGSRRGTCRSRPHRPGRSARLGRPTPARPTVPRRRGSLLKFATKSCGKRCKERLRQASRRADPAVWSDTLETARKCGNCRAFFMAEAAYTAKDITVLEGLEPVRLRPGMYIGSTGARGLHHLIYE